MQKRQLQEDHPKAVTFTSNHSYWTKIISIYPTSYWALCSLEVEHHHYNYQVRSKIKISYKVCYDKYNLYAAGVKQRKID